MDKRQQVSDQCRAALIHEEAGSLIAEARLLIAKAEGRALAETEAKG